MSEYTHEDVMSDLAVLTYAYSPVGQEDPASARIAAYIQWLELDNSWGKQKNYALLEAYNQVIAENKRLHGIITRRRRAAREVVSDE